jgi:hypothetical protein
MINPVPKIHGTKEWVLAHGSGIEIVKETPTHLLIKFSIHCDSLNEDGSCKLHRNNKPFPCSSDDYLKAIKRALAKTGITMRDYLGKDCTYV